MSPACVRALCSQSSESMGPQAPLIQRFRPVRCALALKRLQIITQNWAWFGLLNLRISIFHFIPFSISDTLDSVIG